MAKKPTNTPSDKVGIYGLALGGIVYYVGQSKNIDKRYRQHTSINQTRSDRKLHKWMRENLEAKTIPELLIIEETNDLDSREIHWIEFYRGKGEATLNMSDGGKSMSNLRRAKLEKPWGNSWSPVQRMLIEMKGCQKAMYKYGDAECRKRADTFDDRLLVLNKKIKEFGLHKMNMILWEKYGN